jgi:hypothetical protein
MGSCIQGTNEMRQLLVSVEEEFYTAETRFFGFELEAPFYAGDGGFGAAALFGGECCVGGRGDGGSCFVGDFGGDFVGGYAVASWPSGGIECSRQLRCGKMGCS